MHAQNKFYYKGVSEQRIVASVDAFTVQRFWQYLFKSENNAFLVKWKFGNSYFWIQHTINKEVIQSSNS